MRRFLRRRRGPTETSQIPSSTTHQTDLFAGITPEVQNAIDAMGEEELA
jgi:hypothetical protein